MDIVVEWSRDAEDGTGEQSLHDRIRQALVAAYDDGYECGHDEAVSGAGDE